jgi:iron complex outermembrane receptor protein
MEGKWDVSDKLSFGAQAGTSEGHGETPTQDVAEWDVGLGTGAGWSMHGVGAADWHLGTTNTGAPGTPLVDYRLDWIFGFQDIDVEDKEDWAKIDGTYFTDGGVLQSVDFGIRGAKHERNLDQVTAQGPMCSNGDAFNWDPATFNCPDPATSPFNPANFPNGYSNYPGDFADGIGGNFPRNIWFFSPDQLAAYNDRFTNRDPVSRFFFPGAYGLEERSSAAYMQLNFAGERWTANVGMRYVETKEDITNYVNADATDPAAITTSAFGPYKKLVTKNTYKDWLPSANLKWDVTDDVVLRLAASQTLTRPDFSALAGSVSLLPPATVDGIGSGTGGNPNLKPIISTNLDATLEWYYAERALFSVGAFSMDIDNYVSLARVRQQYLTIDALHPAPGVMVNYDVTIPVNSSAEVHGVELAWEQPFGEYFGAFANYTWAEGDTDDGQPMLGTSEDTYNVGVYFENDMFNARVSYNYRSEFFSGLDRASAFWQDEVDNVSASFGYTINDNFSVTLDAMNLNNPKIKYYAESKERPRSIYENGRQYYLNVRFKY